MDYMEQFTAEFLKPLYYFCLKQTGDENTAGDLAGEISLEILSALSHGTEPENLPAWVWQIARNRFARWLRQHRYGEIHLSR